MTKAISANKLVLCFFTLLLLVACKSKFRDIPFPFNESEFSKPVTYPLKFGNPEKFSWITASIDSGHLPKSKKIDFNSIPVRPFFADGFQSFVRQGTITKIDFTSLPGAAFSYAELSSAPFQIKTSILAPPVIVKAGLTKLKARATFGLSELKEDEGLPGSIVTALLHDKKGMFWIATDQGLCRFDGEHLEIFSAVERAFNGTFATINKMIDDDEGKIWCKTTLNGIYILDWQKGLVGHFDIPPGIENFLLQVSNNEMIRDSRGLIWLGSSYDGIYIADPQKKMLKHMPYLKNKNDGYTKEIIEDNEGRIWVGTYQGITILDLEKNTARFISKKQGLAADSILSLYKDSRGNIWVGSSRPGYDIIDPKKFTIQHGGPEQGIYNSIDNFTEDGKERLWMGSDSGVYVVQQDLQKFRHITKKDGLNEHGVKVISSDNQGQVWIGTTAGLNVADTKNLEPENFDERRGLASADIWAIVQNQDKKIWIGADKTVDIIDAGKNTIQHLGPLLGIDPNLNSTDYVNFLKDHNNNIWIASRSGGLILFNSQNNTATQIHTMEINDNTTSMTEDSKGRIWRCGWSKVYSIDMKNNRLDHIVIGDSTFTNKAWALTDDRTGRIWLGRDSGVVIIDPLKETMTRLIDDSFKGRNQINALLRDEKGRIWIATLKGISIADLTEQTLTHYEVAQGLCAPDVYNLYQYRGKIYAGTGNGLTVFSPNTGQLSSAQTDREWNLQSIGKKQGLIATNFNTGASLGVDDKLWWGVFPNALTITNLPGTDSSIYSPYVTGINITGRQQYFINGKSIKENFPDSDTLWDIQRENFFLKNRVAEDSGYLIENNITWDSISGHFNLPVNLRLPYNQNLLSFQFSAGRFMNQDKIRYRYILEGVDKKWSEISDKPYTQNYYNLVPGNYVFKVRCRNAGGVWGGEASFKFLILPPWWQTWWAYLLYIATFAVFVSLIVRYRLRNLKAQNARLEERIASRTSELNQSLENLKATQSQLIQSEKMASLGELTAGIAHEIQNPLNFVNNFSEVSNELIEEMKIDLNTGNTQSAIKIADDIKNNLEKINHHGKRADAIVKGMMLHSRQSKGVKELTDINALCDEYLRLSYHGIRAKDKSFNARLSTDFDVTVSQINIISQDIGRVIMNLLTNAFYAMNEKKQNTTGVYEPSVSIITKRKGDRVEICVNDNGNGIVPTIVDKIFQPFFTTKPTGQGTGLGLSLAYDIVKAHGGEIKVETTQGEGSKFIIQIPF